MKSSSLLVLYFFFAAPAFSETLPDEINYTPYQSRFENLKKETDSASERLIRSRRSLEEVRAFIRKTSSHIEELQTEILTIRSTISVLRREIPDFERQISQLRSQDAQIITDLRARQNSEALISSRYRDAQNDLRPLEQILSRRQQRLSELERELSGLERSERESGSRLARAQTEADRTERQMSETRSQIQHMHTELRSLDSRITGLQSQLSSLELSRGTLEGNLNTERAKLADLNNRLAENEAELARLRASNAPADAISSAELKLNSVRFARDRLIQDVRHAEGELSRATSEIMRSRGKMDELRKAQATLPESISRAESRFRQLEAERGRIQNDINRWSVDVQGIRRTIEMRRIFYGQEQSEYQVEQQNVFRQQQLVENLGRQVGVLRNEIRTLSERSRDLNSQITRSSETIRSHNARIPKLEEEIDAHEDKIIQGERDLVSARTDEKALSTQVAQDQLFLQDLTARRDGAYAEMNRRLSLYNSYLAEAENLGSSQGNDVASLSGRQEGERLASILSRQNGSSMGREIGIIEARYWGGIRGEIEGFNSGYHDGLESPADINYAIEMASVKAASDGELFAQKNYKPLFFEEFVLEEFKKPLLSLGLTKVVTSATKFTSRRTEISILPLSEEEISQSEALITPLDRSLNELVKDLKESQAKLKQLSSPEVTFEAPRKIPFGKPDCSQVYKKLLVFRASCESAYESTFTSLYVSSARKFYYESYGELFMTIFSDSRISQREKSYPAAFSDAHKISRAEGLRLGKIEIFEKTFERVYKTAYAAEIVKAKARAKADAQRELGNFLLKNPLLTMVGATLSAPSFRGGEEISILSKVKNIGSVALAGPAIVRITSVENAQIVIGEAVLNLAPAKAISDLPDLKVKVLPQMKSGDKIIVRGTVDLPGDLYKASRKESFELTQILSANPTHKLLVDYNFSPNIKGPLRRYVHFVNMKIKPTVEDIKDGYSFSLTPVGEGQEYVELQTAKIETGPILSGVEKEVRLSYLLKDGAKGRKISLELSLSFLGKVIRKELLTVSPK
jgi:septal ring factor EnvC (AmiA/AmiB activator)